MKKQLTPQQEQAKDAAWLHFETLKAAASLMDAEVKAAYAAYVDACYPK